MYICANSYLSISKGVHVYLIVSCFDKRVKQEVYSSRNKKSLKNIKLTSNYDLWWYSNSLVWKYRQNIRSCWSRRMWNKWTRWDLLHIGLIKIKHFFKIVRLFVCLKSQTFCLKLIGLYLNFNDNKYQIVKSYWFFMENHLYQLD